mmetsp:Transcript_32706/g.59727  ORF Transcript_32706/g.59727 Transcript_32706/m.59727 type:complete len:322 (-) Transcript_32706:438-1403(-)
MAKVFPSRSTSATAFFARALNLLLGVAGRGQHDGHAHAHSLAAARAVVVPIRGVHVDVDRARGVERVNQDGVEVKGLHQRTFPHEALQGSCPPFPNHLKPVDVNVGEQGLRQGLGFSQFRASLRQWHRELVLQKVPVKTRRHGEPHGVGGPPREHSLLAQVAHQHLHALVHRHAVVGEVDLRVRGRLVGGVFADPRKRLDLPRRHLGVQPFGVPLLHHRQRHVHEHFQEFQALLRVPLSGRIAVRLVRGHEGDERDDPSRIEQACHLPHPPHAFRPVVGAEAEVAVQPRAHVVAVEVLDVQTVLQHELFFERARDGGLATS